MNKPDDDREGLPSVSAFMRYSMCPASYRLSLAVPESDGNGEASPYAAAGTRGHAALAGEDVTLSLDEQDTIDSCRDQEGALVKTIAGAAPVLRAIREKRLAYRELGVKLFTGRPDVVYILDDQYRTAIVLDYKLGFMPAPVAEVNLQLRGQALLAWQNFGSLRVYVGIIQPRLARWGPMALYGAEELRRAREEIKGLISVLNDPESLPVPSAAACRHCPAKGICTEAYLPAMRLANQTPDGVLTMEDLALSDFVTVAKQVQMIIDLATEELHRRVEERPHAFPSWELCSTGTSSSIPDARAAYGHFRDMLTSEEFSALCKLSLTDLINAVRRVTGLSKPLARQEVDRRLGGLLVKKPKKKTLKMREATLAAPTVSIEVEV